MVDVSDLRRVENRLQESEGRFRQIADWSQDAFYVRERNGQVSYVSPAFEHIWGRPVGWLAGKDSAWLETIDPADRVRVAEAWSRLRGGVAINEVYRIQRPDGSIRWVQSRGFAVEGPNREILRNVGVVRDITNERHLEEQLRHAQKLEAVGTLAGGVAHNLGNVLQAVMASIQLAERSGAHSPESMRALERAVKTARKERRSSTSS